MSETLSIAGRMAAVIAEAAHPKQIILFGSRARHEESDESDFDLMVIEDHPPDRYLEMVRLRRLLRGFRVPIDLLVVSKQNFDYWRDTPGNVYYEAASAGVTLYEAG